MGAMLGRGYVAEQAGEVGSEHGWRDAGRLRHRRHAPIRNAVPLRNGRWDEAQSPRQLGRAADRAERGDETCIIPFRAEGARHGAEYAYRLHTMQA